MTGDIIAESIVIGVCLILLRFMIIAHLNKYSRHKKKVAAHGLFKLIY